MFDEVSTYAKLDSAIFGALVHAVVTTCSAVRGNGAAIRLFNGSDDHTTAMFDGARLALATDVECSLQQWPFAQDSIFEHARRHKMFDAAFRPNQMPEVEGDGFSRLCAPITAHVPVRDAYCITAPLIEDAWCMAVYMRCADCPPFDEKEITLLERFKPAMSRLVRAAYQRHLNRSMTPLDAGTTVRLSPAEAMAKLSRTERQILQHLFNTTTERQIAQAIHRSPHTVHVHVKNIYRKLGVNSRRQLLALLHS